jgi:recombination protein RecT
MSESKALSVMDHFRHTVKVMEPQLAMALPAHIKPDKFIRTLMTTVQMNPSLLECNRESVLGAVMQSAQQGLFPDGKEAAIIKYGEKAQFIPMTAGILKKVRNSGELISIASQIIHEHDKFRYWVDGDGEHLEHDPNLFSDRGKRIGVYAIAKTKNDGVYVEVMTEAQVMAVKKVSKSKSGPWAGDFEEEMWKKTVIRRLSKRLPMSTDLEGLIHSDDDLYDLEPKVTAAETPPAKSSRLAEAVKPKVEKEVSAPPPPPEPEILNSEEAPI